jgi:hypothetical protein
MGKVRARTNAHRHNTKAPWSLQSYPYPDPSLAPDPYRGRSVAPERLFWRSDGSLAIRAGGEYYDDERDDMCTWDELKELSL